MGDKAYVGEDIIVAPIRGNNLSVQQRAYNSHINRYRIIIENTFSWLKKFEILKQKYRNNLENHQQVFFICCELTNIKILFRETQ